MCREKDLKLEYISRSLAEIKQSLAIKYMTTLHSIINAHWRYIENGDSRYGVQELWVGDVIKARITVSINNGIRVKEYGK